MSWIRCQDDVRPVILHIAACLPDHTDSGYTNYVFLVFSMPHKLHKVRYFVTEANSPEVIEVGGNLIQTGHKSVAENLCCGQ